MAEPKGPPPHPRNFQALDEPVSPERLKELGSPAAKGDHAPPATAAPERGGRRVNLHNRESLERFYPRDEFERDAARNADAKASVLHGVRIVSQPGADGGFEIVRAAKNVSEGDPMSDTLFLVPYTTADTAALVAAGEYSAPDQKGGAETGKANDYAGFIDAIVEAAKNARFKRSIGRGDDRLKGFHGG
jgi:hypothetical protein